MRRNKWQLASKITEFKANTYTLDSESLHLDIIRKLHQLKQPQAYLTKRLDISRSTLHRIDKGKEITMTTFLKILAWLDKEPNKYLIKKSEQY